jgi:hypothetical protein
MMNHPAWPIQRASNLDGSVPFSLVLLPAGHRPGLYEIKRMFSRHVAPTAGNIVLQNTWHDPTSGLQTYTSPTLGLGAQGPLGLASNVEAHSDGTQPIIYSGTFTGVTGTPNLEAIGAAYFLGEI